MSDENVRIDDLTIRIPGTSPEEGKALGEEVVRHLVEGLPEQTRSWHLGALELRVSLPSGGEHGDVSRHIAEAILKGLR